MGRWVTLAIIAGTLLLGMGYLWQQRTDQLAREKLAAALADARRTFKERAGEALEEDDEAQYRRQVFRALRAYEDGLLDKVYADRPEWRDPDSYRERLIEQLNERNVPRSKRPRKLEGFEVVKAAYDVLKAGRWKSVLTQVGAGNNRLDIYDVRRVVDDAGRPTLEGRFFFWGLDRSARVNWGQLSLRYWHQVEKRARRSRREVAQVLGRVEGDAAPRVFINNPNEYIAEFPSYVAVGYFWWPVMPREAAHVDIALGYKVKKAGTTHDVELRWTKLPIPSPWQLDEGQPWEADVVQATADELAGKDDSANNTSSN